MKTLTAWKHQAFTAAAMTRLQACSLSTSSEANSPSTSKDGKFASLSYACLMRSKNAARMMHPPFQILAISPKFNPHSCSFDLALIKFMPCAYEVTFDAYNALRTSSINCFLSIPGPVLWNPPALSLCF